MATDFDSKLTMIETKAALVAERFKQVESERRKLSDEVDRLRYELSVAQRSIEQLNARVEYLQLASTILPSDRDVEHSRRFLSELVWEIDKCITQLSE